MASGHVVPEPGRFPDMQNEERASDPQPFGGAQIEFPQSFDLRIIYSIQAGQTIRGDLVAVFALYALPCSRLADIPTKPGRYARIAASVRFDNLEQMRKVYAALGALAGVKALF